MDSAQVARSKHAPGTALRPAPDDPGDAVGYRLRIGRLVILDLLREADLALQVAPHGFGPAVGAGDPGRSARVNPAVECFVALAQFLPFEPREAARRLHRDELLGNE